MPLSEHALAGVAVKPQPTCKICGGHRFFTGRLHDGKRYARAVATAGNDTSVVYFDFTRSDLVARITDALASEYLDSCHISAYVKFRPCSGVGSQSAYVVVHRICTDGPADSAIFFEYFGCGGGFFAVGELRLRKRICFAVGDVLHSFEG